MMTTDENTLGLYLHIPFCKRKCAYCDFYSQTDYRLTDAYLDALLTEISLLSAQYQDRLVDTVYIGGGTPTSLTANELDRLLFAIGKSFGVVDSAEITVEANPATLDEEKLTVLQKNGVNRLSLGLQSASDEELATLSRIHSYHDFETTYRLARDYISNISIDLMFGLPDQTETSFQRTLSCAAALSPEHISLYALKIEKGTPFALREASLNLPDEDMVADMYLFACSFLEKAGYRQYEISNFAKVGKESRHNSRYWKRQEYLGMGPAAHSFVGGKRYANQRDLGAYIHALSRGELPPRSEEVCLTEREILEEEIMLALRLSDGLDLERLEEKTGYRLEENCEKILKTYTDHGFMHRNDAVISLTPQGFLVSNTIISSLLP